MKTQKDNLPNGEQDIHAAAGETYFVAGRSQPKSHRAKWLMPAFAACLGAAPMAQAWAQRDPAATSASAPAPAAATPAGVASNLQSPRDDGIAWLSGGIGEEGRDAMYDAAKDYNVHVLFSSRQGAYLADIPFRLRTAVGDEVRAGTSEGPLLYLRLPAGNYKFSAKVDGVWQTRAVRVVSKDRPVSLIFLARGEEQ